MIDCMFVGSHLIHTVDIVHFTLLPELLY